MYKNADRRSDFAFMFPRKFLESQSETRRKSSKGAYFFIDMLYKFGEREKRRCLSCLYGQLH